MLKRLVTIVLCVASSATAVEDFTALHISDIHVEAHLARTGDPGPLRGGGTINWICDEAGKPQGYRPDGPAAAAPAIALATGDLTEFGVIDDTWAVFEKAFAKLPCPLYVLPGNHDNTWVAMNQIMRRRHGAENYAFDKFGVHFICLNSATLQEPVPSIDAKARHFLADDLSRVPTHQPVIVALHHPPYSNEFAPAEQDTFIDMLKNHNVVLMLYGHGHGVSHRNLDGIDGVMGGSTFGKNAGYGLISVEGNRLRYAYRYHDDPNADGEDPGWQMLLEKTIPDTAPRRFITIDWPSKDGTMVEGQLAVDIAFAVPRAGGGPHTEEVALTIDGEPANATDTPSDASDGRHHRAFLIDTAALAPGGHLLTVSAGMAGQVLDKRTRTFYVERPGADVRWRRQMNAAVKAAPVVVGGEVIVADTGGAVLALDRATGERRWGYHAGGAILAAPLRVGTSLIVASGDGTVCALDAKGRQQWRFDAKLPVYGALATDAALVYFGDQGGRLHALDVGTGAEKWSFARADYAVEAMPLVTEEHVVFGAWDGYLYAVNKADGTLAWKKPGPKSAEGKAVRYYAPADCGPILCGGKIFACDRGYQLGVYALDGTLERKAGEQIAAIALDPKQPRYYGRTIDDRVIAADANGATLWDTAVAAGRFPVPPTVAGNRIYTCSNRGLLSVLDAATGKLLASYQATPGYYVMAPVAVDGEAVCYVAGIDGSVTAVRLAGAQRGAAK